MFCGVMCYGKGLPKVRIITTLIYVHLQLIARLESIQYPMFFLPALNSRTVALLAIVCGLVVLCLGLWYIWNAQQMLQYVRNQCDSLQRHILHPVSAKTVTDPSVEVEQTVSAIATHQTQQSVEDVVHRSCVLADAADSTFATVVEDTDLSEDDTTDDDDEYDDDDQAVDTTDLVDLVENHSSGNFGDSVAEGDACDMETTNQLVDSLLSTIVQQVEDAHATSPPTPVADSASATDESVSVEDFVESKGNYATLTETLRKKTVVELKKMCTEHQIGVKKGKSFKRKEELIEELIEELVEKMPHQTA